MKNSCGFLFALSLLIFISLTFYLLLKIKKMNSKIKSLSSLLESHKLHFDRLVFFEDEFKSAWHDYKNHLLCIKGFLQSKDYNELGKYLDRLTGVFSIRPEFATGSIAADSILSAKKQLAQQSGIVFECSASLPKTINVDEADICIVLSNILDNAIEACLEINDKEKRIVKLDIGYKNDYIQIRLSNSVARSERKIKRGIFSGIGMKNVSGVVSKYEGACQTELSGSEFITRIIIKNKKV